jgi:hypothetical protein
MGKKNAAGNTFLSGVLNSLAHAMPSLRRVADCCPEHAAEASASFWHLLARRARGLGGVLAT